MAEPHVSDLGPLQDAYRDHYLALVRLARQLVDDVETAEDVVQDVFASLHENEAPRDMLRYLQTAVVNRSRSVLRRRKVVRAFLIRRRPEGVVGGADEEALRGDSRAAMLRAIDRLPRRQREVVVLRYYADLNAVEISRTLGLSASAVSSALNRAMSSLSTILERSDHDH